METCRSQRIKFMQKCSYCDSNSKSHHHANKNMNKDLNNTKSCKVISKLLLPEDLMIHIFTLVPLTCPLNSARYVCKSWAITIRSPYFTEACERRGYSKPGFYVENCTTRRNSCFLEFKDDVNGKFERTDLGIPHRMGHVISTCDGILLLWNGLRETFVVNPILKCWLRMPPFPRSQYMVLGIQFTIVRVPRTAKFKLFYLSILKVSGALWYVCYALRIGIDNSWKEIVRKEFFRNNYINRQLLYSGGNNLYWITQNEVVLMDVDKEIIVRGYPLPHVSNGRNLTYLWMVNRLSCIAYYHIDLSYKIYILDFHSGKWYLYHEMRVRPLDYVAACGQELNNTTVVFRLWINDQIIFRVTLPPIDNIFTNLKKIHFGYNIRTKQLTKIEGIDVGNFEVWLHTNSLVSLPST